MPAASAGFIALESPTLIATLARPKKTASTGADSPTAKPKASRLRVAVVGNGPVGWKFCELIAERQATARLELTVFGEEPRAAYDRVHLTDYFEHRDGERLSLASRSWYEEHGIDLRTGDPVIELDTKLKRVRTQSGTVHFYDRLILATGSRPFVPPLPGVDLPHVHVYRTLSDVEAIAGEIDRLKELPGSSAAVLGGGLLGLEAARAMHDAGIETHVFELASVLMPKQLDTTAAALLQAEVERLGVHVHTLARTKAIAREDDGRLELHLDGESAPLVFDTIVISAGIRPRDDLAKSAGIACDIRGGIIVSDKLETDVEGVYAIGECAVHNETVYGLVAPGFHMAGIVADRLTSRLPVKPVFKGHDNATRLKLLGVEVVTLGDFLREDVDSRVLVHRTDTTYRKLIVKGTRVIGATLVGPCEELPRLSESIQNRRRVGHRSLHRFTQEGRLWKPDDAQHVSEWPAGATVCSCMQVSRGQLTKACEKGCETVECLVKQTKASTVCGSCRPLLAELVGSPETAGGVAGWRALGGIAAVSIAVIAAAITFGPLEYSESMQTARFEWDQFLLDDFWKQVTGYTLVGFSVLATLLSLRKRWPKFSAGTYGLWRVFHSVVGMACLFGLILHTGMHFGANLNLALMLSFLGTVAVGGFTGVITSIESRAGKPPPPWVKRWRPRLTWLHVLLTWPLPVLIAFHILAFYMHAD